MLQKVELSDFTALLIRKCLCNGPLFFKHCPGSFEHLALKFKVTHILL